MARYSLVVKENGNTFIVPFGKNSKGVSITKVDLEEIDFFTNSFSNFCELETFIKQKYNIPFLSCFFEVQYTYNGTTKRLNVFVNNSFLKKCAKYNIQRKKIAGKGGLTEEIPEFTSFQKRILHYIKEENSFAILKNDTTGLIPFGIKNELESFHQLSNLTHQTPDQVLELSDVRKRILHILSDYKNMREMLRWEQLYLNGNLKRKEPKIDKVSLYNSLSIGEKNEIEDEEDYDEYAFLSEEEKMEMVGYEEEATYRRLK